MNWTKEEIRAQTKEWLDNVAKVLENDPKGYSMNEIRNKIKPSKAVTKNVNYCHDFFARDSRFFFENGKYYVKPSRGNTPGELSEGLRKVNDQGSDDGDEDHLSAELKDSMDEQVDLCYNFVHKCLSRPENLVKGDNNSYFYTNIANSKFAQDYCNDNDMSGEEYTSTVISKMKQRYADMLVFSDKYRRIRLAPPDESVADSVGNSKDNKPAEKNLMKAVTLLKETILAPANPSTTTATVTANTPANKINKKPSWLNQHLKFCFDAILERINIDPKHVCEFKFLLSCRYVRVGLDKFRITEQEYRDIMTVELINAHSDALIYQPKTDCFELNMGDFGTNNNNNNNNKSSQGNKQQQQHSSSDRDSSIKDGKEGVDKNGNKQQQQQHTSSLSIIAPIERETSRGASGGGGGGLAINKSTVSAPPGFAPTSAPVSVSSQSPSQSSVASAAAVGGKAAGHAVESTTSTSTPAPTPPKVFAPIIIGLDGPPPASLAAATIIPSLPKVLSQTPAGHGQVNDGGSGSGSDVSSMTSAIIAAARGFDDNNNVKHKQTSENTLMKGGDGSLSLSISDLEQAAPSIIPSITKALASPQIPFDILPILPLSSNNSINAINNAGGVNSNIAPSPKVTMLGGLPPGGVNHPGSDSRNLAGGSMSTGVAQQATAHAPVPPLQMRQVTVDLLSATDFELESLVNTDRTICCYRKNFYYPYSLRKVKEYFSLYSWLEMVVTAWTDGILRNTIGRTSAGKTTDIGIDNNVFHLSHIFEYCQSTYNRPDAVSQELYLYLVLSVLKQDVRLQYDCDFDSVGVSVFRVLSLEQVRKMNLAFADGSGGSVLSGVAAGNRGPLTPQQLGLKQQPLLPPQRIPGVGVGVGGGGGGGGGGQMPMGPMMGGQQRGPPLPMMPPPPQSQPHGSFDPRDRDPRGLRDPRDPRLMSMSQSQQQMAGGPGGGYAHPQQLSGQHQAPPPPMSYQSEPVKYKARVYKPDPPLQQQQQQHMHMQQQQQSHHSHVVQQPPYPPQGPAPHMAGGGGGVDASVLNARIMAKSLAGNNSNGGIPSGGLGPGMHNHMQPPLPQQPQQQRYNEYQQQQPPVPGIGPNGGPSALNSNAYTSQFQTQLRFGNKRLGPAASVATNLLMGTTATTATGQQQAPLPLAPLLPNARDRDQGMADNNNNMQAAMLLRQKQMMAPPPQPHDVVHQAGEKFRQRQQLISASGLQIPVMIRKSDSTDSFDSADGDGDSDHGIPLPHGNGMSGMGGVSSTAGIVGGGGNYKGSGLLRTSDSPHSSTIVGGLSTIGTAAAGGGAAGVVAGVVAGADGSSLLPGSIPLPRPSANLSAIGDSGGSVSATASVSSGAGSGAGGKISGPNSALDDDGDTLNVEASGDDVEDDYNVGYGLW